MCKHKHTLKLRDTLTYTPSLALFLSLSLSLSDCLSLAPPVFGQLFLPVFLLPGRPARPPLVSLHVAPAPLSPVINQSVLQVRPQIK